MVTTITNLVYIGLGTNLGDKKNNIDNAIYELEVRVGKMIAHSSLLETTPVGFDSDNLFINSACIFETQLQAIEVLNITKDIEIKLGRTSKSINFQYKDRLIDIDILLYNDLILDLDNLTIPHPQLQYRSFVLDPLVEIASDYIHPILLKSLKELKVENDARV